MSVTEITSRKEYICLDCGKVTMSADLKQFGAFQEMTSVGKCPRCMSENITEYIEAQHANYSVEVPESYEHPMEKRAQLIYERVKTLTGWREDKVRLWFQMPNPLLGNVPPEVMIMASEDRCARLEKFIEEAEELNKDWHERAAGDKGS